MSIIKFFRCILGKHELEYKYIHGESIKLGVPYCRHCGVCLTFLDKETKSRLGL